MSEEKKKYKTADDPNPLNLTEEELRIVNLPPMESIAHSLRQILKLLEAGQIHFNVDANNHH